MYLLFCVVQPPGFVQNSMQHSVFHHTFSPSVAAVLIRPQIGRNHLLFYQKDQVWFLCFNGISTLCRLFNAEAILLEEQ